MTTNNPLKAALATAVISLMPLCAEASLMKAATFDEKVENAAAIVVGECMRQEAKWDPSGRFILTYSTFKVEKAIKGRHHASEEITIVTPGGSVGDVHQDTIGIPSFRTGEENLLFVKNSEVGPTVLYFDQGAYDVVTDARGERVVRPIATEAVHIDTQRGVAVPAEEARPLRQFEGEVRAAEKRIAFQRAQVLEKQKKEESSVWSAIRRNKLLVILALVGAALATWQLVKRS